MNYMDRAKIEAAAILNECGVTEPVTGDILVTLMASAWLQGTIYGSHETLALAEVAFESTRDAL